MKTILLIVPSLKRGGSERVISILYNELKKFFKIKVIIFHGPEDYKVDQRDLIKLNTPAGNRVKQVMNTFIRVFKLRRIFHHYKPYRIISFLGNYQPILSLYPIIVSIRANPHNPSSFIKPYDKYIFKYLYTFKNIKKIVVPSNDLKILLESDFNFKNISVIKNPIQTDVINQMKKEKIKIDYHYIVAVGRLNKLKAFDVLIRAFHRAKIEQNIKLVIIGEGKKRQELENLINDLDLSERVRLPGLKSNPFKYMYNAKFLVCTSTYEGSPNVVIEALYCDIPVIATDCPTGPSEIIQNNYNGLLVPVNDIDKISNAIKKLCSDKTFYNMLKKNSKESVSSFHNDIISKEWLKFLNSKHL